MDSLTFVFGMIKYIKVKNIMISTCGMKFKIPIKPGCIFKINICNIAENPLDKTITNGNKNINGLTDKNLHIHFINAGI